MNIGTLKIVPLSEISVSFSDRGRKEYKNIEALGFDILKRGLINPLTVYSPTGNAPYTLLCGGRRYMALRHIATRDVSVRIYDHVLSEDERLTIELMENLQREDLTEMEKVMMTKLIDETLKHINGPKLGGSKSHKGHSMRDTAKLLGRSQSSVQQDIALASAVERHPELELEKAPNKTVAKKVVERLRAFTESRIGESLRNSPPDASYIVGDFLENSLPGHSFDFIECDPPYGIDLLANKYVKDRKNISGYKEIPKEEYPYFVCNIIAECSRLAKPDAYLIWWHSVEWYDYIMNELTASDWIVSHNPGIWIKGYATGQTRWPEYELGNAYEQFLIARRGAAQLHVRGRSNVFNYDGVHSVHKVHPAEKPAALMGEILRVFCWPGANILVPFAGSGRTIIEAHRMEHSAVGFDLYQENKDIFTRSNE